MDVITSIALFVFLVANCIDAALTIGLVGRGAKEANPAMQWLVTQPALFGLTKGLVGAAVAAYVLHVSHPAAARIAAIGLAVGYVGIVIHNLRVAKTLTLVNTIAK